MRALALLLTALACAAPASAQWQRVTPTSMWDHTDFAIRNGVIVLTLNGTGSSGVRRSVDGGATWTTPTLIRPAGGGSEPYTDGTNAVVARPSGFLTTLSVSAGPSADPWTQALSGPPNMEGFNIYRYHTDALTGALYAVNYAPAVGAAALARSLDSGATWTTMTGPFTRLSFVHARGATLLAGLAVGGAYLSVDGGATWTDLATRGVAGAGVGGFIEADGTLYVNLAVGNFLGRTELWRSRDGGQTWTNLTASITPVPPDTPNSRTGIVYAEGPRILFSAACQLYLSANDGATWTQQSANIPACTVAGSSGGGISQMAFDGGFMYVLRRQFLSGNQGADWGLYRRPLSELGFAGPTTAAEGGAPPAGLALTVSPNPARGAARLRFTLDAPQAVTVAVYDALGRRMAVIHDGPLAAGPHTLDVDGAALAPGVYVVRALTPDGVTAHRLTLVR